MTRVLVGFIFCLGSAWSAFAQVDAYTLREKYGAPLNREVFAVRPGVEMVVDYGPNKQVCRIQLPSGIRYGGTVPVDAVSKEKIDAVLEEVVPPSIRGKELGQMFQQFGLAMISSTDYEHVDISEVKAGDVGKGITVTFKDSACPNGQLAGKHPPRRLRGGEPEYTEAARKANLNGTVELQIDIDASGSVTNAHVVKSLDGGLDENCVHAVQGWLFEAGNATPAMKVECESRVLDGLARRR